MSYPVAADEAQRLAGLRNLHILDTAAELPFDTLTAIARQHFAAITVARQSWCEGTGSGPSA